MDNRAGEQKGKNEARGGQTCRSPAITAIRLFPKGNLQVSAEDAVRMKEALEWARMILDQQIADGMDELTASQEFNDALEFSSAAKEICNDDMSAFTHPDRKERWRLITQLKDKDREDDTKKFRYLIETPMLELISKNAYDAISDRHGKLMVKATKLRLNKQKVEPASLARELGISVATFCRKFELKKIRRACKPPCELPIAQLPQSTAAKKTVTKNYNDEDFRDEGF
jgi:hypothetical protein